MNKKTTKSESGSVCIRCGKQRIIIDSYEEKVETSTVVYTVSVCSDDDCQKIVDKRLKEEEKKRMFVKEEQGKRELQRKQALAEKKLAKAA